MDVDQYSSDGASVVSRNRRNRPLDDKFKQYDRKTANTGELATQRAPEWADAVMSHHNDKRLRQEELEAQDLNAKCRDLAKADAKKLRRQIANEQQVAAARALDNSPLPCSFLISALQDMIKLRDEKIELVIYLPFLLVFSLLVFTGTASGLWWASKGLEEVLVLNAYATNLASGPFFVKNYYDIINPSDWYQWSQGVFAPNFWQTIESQNPRYVTGSNQLFGTVRFRTVRVKSDSCSLSPSERLFDLLPIQPRTCYAQYSSSAEQKSPYGGPNGTAFQYADVEGDSVRGEIATYQPGGYVMDYPGYLTQAEATAQIADLQTNDYIDQYATRAVIVEFFTYNTPGNFFTHARILAEQSAGGSWVLLTKYRSFTVWTTDDLASTIISLIFFVYVMYYYYKMFSGWYAYYKKYGNIFGYWTNLWTVVEFINLVTFLIVLILKVAWLMRSTSLDIKLPGNSNVFPSDLIQIESLHYNALWLNAVNIFFCFLKLIRFMELSARLRVLVLTAREIQSALTGVVLLFLLVLSAYAISGIYIYGSFIWEYREFTAAMTTLMIMLLGDFDYEELRGFQPILTPIYFFSFNLIGLFIIINFIISICTSAFTEVASQVSVPSIKETLEWRKRRLVSLFRHKAKLRSIKSWFTKPKTRPPIVTLLQYIVHYAMADAGEGIHTGRLFYENELVRDDYAGLKRSHVAISKAQLRDIIPRNEMRFMGLREFELIWENLAQQHARSSPEALLEAEYGLFYKSTYAVLRHLFNPSGAQMKASIYHQTDDELDGEDRLYLGLVQQVFHPRRDVPGTSKGVLHRCENIEHTLSFANQLACVLEDRLSTTRYEILGKSHRVLDVM